IAGGQGLRQGEGQDAAGCRHGAIGSGPQGVLEGLEWLEKSEKGDVSLLFLAGHGITDRKGQFYFLAADSDPDSSDLDGSAISRNRILGTIQQRKGSMVVMFDACRSGASVDMNRLPNELTDTGEGVMVYASTRGKTTPSYEHEDWKHGAFTLALIEGLKGKADHTHLGIIEADDLGAYVRKRVFYELTKRTQEPVFLSDTGPMRALAKYEP